MRSVPLICCAIHLGQVALAQEPAWQWARSAGGDQLEDARAVATDAVGNAFVVGAFYSATFMLGDTTLLNYQEGSGDFYCAKYGPTGEVLWVRQGTGPSLQQGVSVAVDAQGNVFVAGDFYSSIALGSESLTSAGNTDVFVAKYSADGTLLWATSAGNNTADASTDLASDGAGGVLLTGYFTGPSITFGNDVLQNQEPYSDAYLVRYDGVGNVLWARSAGSDHVVGGHGVAADAAGNVVLTGYFAGASLNIGTTQLDNASADTRDLFLAKYAPDGTFLWALSAGGAQFEQGYDVAVDSNNDILLCGSFAGPSFTIGGTELTNSTGDGELLDVFLAKYHEDGTPVWARSGGGNINDYAMGVAVDGQNNVVIAGLGGSDAFTFGPLNWTASIAGDVLLVKYAPDGQELWAVHAGGNDVDAFWGLAVDPAGDLLIAGTVGSSSLTIGNTVLTNEGMVDLMLLKLGIATGAPEAAVDGVALYPVPSSGRVTITSPEPMRELLVHDAMGRMVYRATPNSRQAELHVSTPGVYLLQIAHGRTTLSRRLVIGE